MSNVSQDGSLSKPFRNQIIGLVTFIFSLAFGIFLPTFAPAWMFLLLVIGISGKRSKHGTRRWHVSRAALASALAIAVIIIMEAFFFQAVGYR
jgi:hypothetical protein